MDDMLGIKLSWLFLFLYILYFVYIVVWVLWDFGEMLLMFVYYDMLILIVNVLLMIVCIYVVRKGIEVFVCVVEFFFGVMYILGVFGFVLIIVLGFIDM